MTTSNQSPPSNAALAPSMASVLRSVVGHRGVRTAVVVWIAGYAIVLWLARGSLPFDRPAVAGLPFAVQMASPTVGLIEIFVLMVLTFLLTRRRAIPDLAGRAPERRVALREMLIVFGWAALGQVGGWIVGPALGYRSFSFHLAGAVFGCAVAPVKGEIWTWAFYNFVVFAVAPYLFFRRRYSNTQLSLRSTNRRNDTLVIVVVLAIESAFELIVFDRTILNLSPRQILLGAPLTFALFFIGTVLPTMVLIYAILLPRFLRLTGSAISTVLLGGLAYAAMHIVEGWSAFDSPRDTLLSVIFVLFTYFGPGMMKSVLTLRTGNAWVHAFSYHAFAPHVLVDTPLMVKVFGIGRQHPEHDGTGPDDVDLHERYRKAQGHPGEGHLRGNPQRGWNGFPQGRRRVSVTLEADHRCRVTQAVSVPGVSAGRRSGSLRRSAAARSRYEKPLVPPRRSRERPIRSGRTRAQFPPAHRRGISEVRRDGARS
jgi:hypothetical protein